MVCNKGKYDNHHMFEMPYIAQAASRPREVIGIYVPDQDLICQIKCNWSRDKGP